MVLKFRCVRVIFFGIFGKDLFLGKGLFGLFKNYIRILKNVRKI